MPVSTHHARVSSILSYRIRCWCPKCGAPSRYHPRPSARTPAHTDDKHVEGQLLFTRPAGVAEAVRPPNWGADMACNQTFGVPSDGGTTFDVPFDGGTAQVTVDAGPAALLWSQAVSSKRHHLDVDEDIGHDDMTARRPSAAVRPTRRRPWASPPEVTGVSAHPAVTPARRTEQPQLCAPAISVLGDRVRQRTGDGDDRLGQAQSTALS